MAHPAVMGLSSWKCEGNITLSVLFFPFRETTPITRTEPNYTEHLKRYTEANAAKVGQAVGCPWCGTQFTKKTYNHRFCCPAHKDEFWNAVKPERLEAKARKQRG